MCKKDGPLAISVHRTAFGKDYLQAKHMFGYFFKQLSGGVRNVDKNLITFFPA